MKKAIIGIDPGLEGSITVLDEDHSILLLERTTEVTGSGYDVMRMLQLIQKFSSVRKCIAYIEKPIAMPLIRSTDLAKIFFGYGLWSAALEFSLVVFNEDNEIAPNDWSKEIVGIPTNKIKYADRKKRNAQMAKQLFPEWNPQTMKQLYAEADSLLIAEYGYRKEFSMVHRIEACNKLDPVKYIKSKNKKSKSANIFLE